MKKTNITISVLDLNCGNIFSLTKALEYLGYKTVVTDSNKKVLCSDVVFLPGDGNFGFFLQSIRNNKIDDTIHEFLSKQKFLFGICVGFQSLFASSQESTNQIGLGVIAGNLEKFSSKNVRVPHIGWEKTYIDKKSNLFKGMSEFEYFYYIHSYSYQKRHKYSAATCFHDIEFTSIIEKDNVFGTQFHPEKSGKKGLLLLENFMNIVQK